MRPKSPAARAGREVADIVHEWFDPDSGLTPTEAFGLIIVSIRRHGLLFPDELPDRARKRDGVNGLN